MVTSFQEFPFCLNQELCVSELAEAYSHKRRLQIRHILAPDSAEYLARCLESEVPWGLACCDVEPKLYRAEEVARWSDSKRKQLIGQIYRRATREFQYAYACYPMLDAYLQSWAQVPALDCFLDYLNSDEMLSFVRTVTGRRDIIKGDAQATRYGPGHFLKCHNDDVESEYRAAAYVFNFTRRWDADWGGYLQFYDENGDIEQAFLPRFNTLNIFTVPQRHSVSYVPAYAGGARYAITGWFRFK